MGNNSKTELKNTLEKVLNINNKINPLKIKKKFLLDRNYGLNEKIESDSQKIQEIKNNDPNREKKAADNLSKYKELLEKEMRKLEMRAPKKKMDIEAALDAASEFNQNEKNSFEK